MLLNQRTIFTFFLFLQAFIGHGQVGSRQVFSFLDNPAGARLAALGSVNVSAPGTDATMLQANPALLQAGMHKHLALSYTDYIADISLSSVYYAVNHPKYGQWGAGLQYLGYGDFTQTDPTGQSTGSFSVHDYVLSLTHATTLKPFTLGATLKFALSGIAEYKSTAALVDLGGIYKHPEKELYVGLALKNIGYQLKTFTGEKRVAMPFDAQLGVTYKPEHMPLQFSVTAHHLQQFNISYSDTTQSGLYLVNPPATTFTDKLARHFVVSSQFLLSKNFQVIVGYNHLRRQELRLETKSGGAGLSMGATVRVKSFEFIFTRAYYHVAGASNAFTVISNVTPLFKKKTRV
ncbi:type IX secretion system protein PorQ [Adhaeribacter swui]|uniref:Type IX secretion system protein PorQ n=1 Tax=Adhaeribacter swui TaxID=2086471 RepID=A0A7G7G3Z0_9BACT|nr:type IX secretion system protein PorQ [Adhaeribacter swui]QNF31874.1 type IX secretion system protein PorQ [Adhaeribacter swui]